MGSIAIVGGGFSGSMVAAHLLRSATACRVTLIERLGPFGGGVAYGTRCASHVLNVPAGRMSALEGDPDHFLRWLRQRDATVKGGAFVPRPVYGEYVRHVLAEAEKAAPPGTALERIPGEAVGIERAAPTGAGREDGGLRVVLANGRATPADAVVLAIGNFPPADPDVPSHGLFSDPRYARDPWAHDALDVDPEAPVLLIGTGLTMLDIALALRDRGHRGGIHAISRRGLLPQPHRPSAAAPRHHDRPASLGRWDRTALGLLRGLRREVARAAAHRVDWREVVTSIRAQTPALWGSLAAAERRRFLEHLRPFWETHRHRAAPQTWQGVEAMLNSGQLRITAARLEAFNPDAKGVGVEFRPRGGARTDRARVSRVINCTGPDTNLARVREALVVSLRNAGLIRPDPLGLGLDTDEDGRVLDSHGRAGTRLFLVGPLRKGRLWENTAVPELRVEAERLAGTLVGTLASDAARPASPGRAGGAQGRPSAARG
ncbi:MAG: FAD/NAD(P)-binding protein [Phycisphaerales bacterium]